MYISGKWEKELGKDAKKNLEEKRKKEKKKTTLAIIILQYSTFLHNGVWA